MASLARARTCFVRRVVGTTMCTSVLVMLAGVIHPCSASPRGHASDHKQFAAIENTTMPGLPASNWPVIQFVDIPPRVGDTANVGSNDLKYTVTFFDFPTPAAAAAFYDAPPGSMLAFLRGAQGYASLSGPTGIPSPSRGLDLRSCAGEGSGVLLFPTGQCSDGTPSFSIGVGTIARIGPVVMMVGYVRNNALTKVAKSSELVRNVKVALSGVKLLRSIGITSP